MTWLQVSELNDPTQMAITRPAAMAKASRTTSVPISSADYALWASPYRRRSVARSIFPVEDRGKSRTKCTSFG
jgi:hypothetical protein